MKVVPKSKFYADFKNPFLNCHKSGDLGEKVLFVNLPSSFLSETRKNMFFGLKAIPNLDDSAKSAKTTPNNHSTSNLLRSQVQHPATTSSGVFQSTCIFCNLERKRSKHRNIILGNCGTKDAEQAIKNAATKIQDTCLLAKICHVDFVAKEVKYHHTCRKQYINKANRVQSTEHDKDKSVYGDLREGHNRPFLTLSKYISENVLKNNHSYYSFLLHINLR